MKIELANRLVETKKETINGFTNYWFRIDKSNVWYKSPYNSEYELISELSKLSKKGLISFLELIKEHE